MTVPPSQRFLRYAERVRHEIDAALDEFTTFGPGCPNVLREAMRYSLLAPGKRLRPLLVLMACDACGCDHRLAMPAAVAVEMVHTYSLIHDDLPAMDDDDLRRGMPTCHIRFGEANAILAGDALLARAFELVAANLQPPEVGVRACAELARAAGPEALVGGQADDLGAQFGEQCLDHLEAIHRRKTGAMFLVSLRLGGIVARASETQMSALTTYGKGLGLAFQIVDDLLDARGDESRMGKRTHKDNHRGKLTFPALLGIDESRRRAALLIDEACSVLEVFGAERLELEGLARYVIERDQ